MLVNSLKLTAHGTYQNNELRYSMYVAAAAGIWGHLGAGNRRQLPYCVTEYVHDCYPEKSREHYVGYKADGSVAFDDGEKVN